MSTSPSITIGNSPAIETPKESAQRIGGALLLVYIWWFLVYCDPHYLLAYYLGGGFILRRITIVLLIPIFIVLVQRGATKAVYWPMALFAAMNLISVMASGNRGLAFAGFKTMFFLLIPFTAAIAVVRTPSQALILHRMLLVSFLWYLIQGIPFGSVPWHHILGNTDAFGPLGAMAMGCGYFHGLGSKSKKWRYLGFGIAALGALAVVASFARGAFLAALTVGAVVWLRSPRKLATLCAGIAGVILISGAAKVFFPSNEFWDEMATITEGTSTGTGESRWILWTQVGWSVFLESPIIGVGAHNTGVVASRIIPPGAIEGRWAQPDRLYHRPLHNIYLQILVEQGIVGFLIWIGMLADFFRRLGTLRTKSARAAWSRAVGGQCDLLYVSLALEATMVGFLVGGIFYNGVYRHWFYTLVLQALIISGVTRRLGSEATRTSPAQKDHSQVRAPRLENTLRSP